jgi:hypothetical protein
VKNDEADNDGLQEKENGVKLVVPLVSRDRCRRQAREIKQVTDEVLGP